MKRLLTKTVVFGACVIMSGYAQTTNESRLEVLNQIIHAIDALSDAMPKISTSLKAMPAGEGLVSAALLQTTKASLTALSTPSTRVSLIDNAKIEVGIESYLAHPTALAWIDVKIDIDRSLSDGIRLLQNWRNEREGDVSAGESLASPAASTARVNLLIRLQTLPAPKTEAELQALTNLNRRYKHLLTVFKDVETELDTYLKKLLLED